MTTLMPREIFVGEIVANNSELFRFLGASKNRKICPSPLLQASGVRDGEPWLLQAERLLVSRERSSSTEQLKWVPCLIAIYARSSRPCGHILEMGT